MKTVDSILKDEFYDKEMARAISEIRNLIVMRGYTVQIEADEESITVTPKNVDCFGVWFGVE